MSEDLIPFPYKLRAAVTPAMPYFNVTFKMSGSLSGCGDEQVSGGGSSRANVLGLVRHQKGVGTRTFQGVYRLNGSQTVLVKW